MSRRGRILGKIVATALIGGALLSGGLIYRLKPEWFDRVEPAVESIVDSVTEESTKLPVPGKYRCNITEEQRIKQRVSKVWSHHAPVSSKHYSLDITVSTLPGTVIVMCSEIEFSTAVGFVRRNEESRLTSYQNIHTVFGTFPEGTTLDVLDDGRLIIMQDHWFSETRSRSKLATCKLIAPEFVRGVFIRTCPGQLYTGTLTPGDYSSEGNSKQPDPEKLAKIATIPIGTLGGVCQDLRDSGVTDIFIPFRVDDHESAPGCGYYGQLLYPSKQYPDRVSQKVRDAQHAGFDLVGSLMRVCKQVYGDTQIRFHAWFPVFKDPYAAQLQGVRGKLRFNSIDTTDIAGNVVDHVAAAVSPDGPAYVSHLFADPKNARVVAYELAVLAEIMKLYPDLYGINLDYIRYPDEWSVFDLPMTKSGIKIESELDQIYDPMVGTEPQHIAKRIIWEVDGNAVDSFVRRASQKFPDIVLSADVFSSPGVRLVVGQFGVPGLVDVVMPMQYTGFGGYKRGEIIGDLDVISTLIKQSTKIVPDVRGWRSPPTQTASELLSDLAEDLTEVRKGGTTGYAIFTYEALLDQSRSTSLSSIKKTLDF